MSTAPYFRYELLRTLRNRRFLIFSLGFPLLLFVFVAGANRSKSLDGISFALYYMTGMVAYGSIIAIISAGGRIAAERQLGWTRQLRITPLRTRTYFASKLASGYMMALLTIVVLYFAGTVLGVRLSASEWALMTLMLLIGLIPFAILGIMLGHVLKPDSLGPAIGGISSLFALFGGAWTPLSTSHTFVDVVKCIPSFWLVQAGKIAIAGSGFPPAEAWIVLGVWSVVLARLAVVAYRRDTTRVV